MSSEWRSPLVAASAVAFAAMVAAGSAVGALSAVAAPGSHVTTAASDSTGRTPGSREFVITSSRMVASNLVFRGVAAVTSGAARLQVMHFTLNGVSLAAFSATAPCLDHAVTTVSIGATRTATASGGVTLDATLIRMTLAGAAPLTFTGSAPPSPLSPLPLPSPLIVTSVTIVATYLSAGQFAAPGSTTSLASC